jgi:hypothetical protein
MSEPAHFIKTFVTDLDAALGKLKPKVTRKKYPPIFQGRLFKIDVLYRHNSTPRNLRA